MVIDRRVRSGVVGGFGRRGVAMVLVLVAMVVAVVLTSAAIVSREVSPSMGVNATASVSTAWSAESAANYAVGAMVGGFDWQGAIGPGGVLVESMEIGGVEVRVTLADLEGNVPDSEDRDLLMTAVATVDGVSTTVRRLISLGVGGDPIDAIDLGLGEFALVGSESLTVETGGSLGVWAVSPESGLRPQVKLGTCFASSSDLDVCLDFALGPVEMHVDNSGDAGLVSEVSVTGYDLQWQMPLPIPVYPVGVPGAVTVALPGGGDLEPGAGASVAVAGQDYDRIRVRDGATATIDGSVSPVVRCNRLEVEDGVVRIVGDVSILVRQELRVRGGGAVVLADGGARLTVYLCDSMVVEEGSQVGVAESDAGRAASEVSAWIGPDRVRLVEVHTSQGGSGDVDVLVQGGSTVLGSICLSSGDFDLLGSSTLIGRATATDVVVGAGSAVWYCPTLDNRMGFSNPNGPLYEADYSADPVVSDALVEALTSGAVTAEQFMVNLRSSYSSLLGVIAVVEDIGAGVGTAVESTTGLFTGLLGID